MRHLDTQFGAPELPFVDTAANLTANHVTEGMVAFASDTHMFGYRNASAWVYPTVGLTGSGTQNRFAMWDTTGVLKNSYLAFSGTNVLTLEASGTATLTVPATGTAALLATTNIFSVLQTAAISDSATNTIVNPFAVTHNSSSGSTTAGFGAKIRFNLKSTTTADTDAGDVQTEWVVGTHASRTSRMTFHVTDYGGSREVIRIQTNGTVGMLGFFGIGPVIRASTYTQTYNTASKTAAALTYVSPGAYIGGTNGYSTTTQAQAIITALGQLSADTIAIYKVVTQIIDDLQAYGLLT